MATRTARLSTRHVEALNLIEIEFDPKQKADAKVLDAWKIYLDILGDAPGTDAQKAAAFQKREDQFIELLWELGRYVGSSFDKVTIKRHAYSPIAHGELEDDQRLIERESSSSSLGSARYQPLVGSC